MTVKVLKKMAEVRRSIRIGDIPKSGNNRELRTWYHTEEDYVHYLTPKLLEAGLWMAVTVTKSKADHFVQINGKGKDAPHTSGFAEVKLTITDLDSGESLDFTCCGYAQHQKGDTALTQSITTATRLAIMRTWWLQKEPEGASTGGSYRTSQTRRTSGNSGTSRTQQTPKPVKQRSPMDIATQTGNAFGLDAATVDDYISLIEGESEIPRHEFGPEQATVIVQELCSQFAIEACGLEATQPLEWFLQYVAEHVHKDSLGNSLKRFRYDCERAMKARTAAATTDGEF